MRRNCARAFGLAACSEFHLCVPLYDDTDPVSLCCNSISFFRSPFLFPCAFDFTHALSMSCDVCPRLGCICTLYKNVGLFASASVATVEAPSSESSEGVLPGRGHARLKASGSPYRLFSIDWGPIATCFQWLGRSHLKNGPSVGMQAAIRAK